MPIGQRGSRGGDRLHTHSQPPTPTVRLSLVGVQPARKCQRVVGPRAQADSAAKAAATSAIGWRGGCGARAPVEPDTPHPPLSPYAIPQARSGRFSLAMAVCERVHDPS
jgi:hypothetical protein